MKNPLEQVADFMFLIDKKTCLLFKFDYLQATFQDDDAAVIGTVSSSEIMSSLLPGTVKLSRNKASVVTHRSFWYCFTTPFGTANLLSRSLPIQINEQNTFSFQCQAPRLHISASVVFAYTALAKLQNEINFA